MATSYIDINGQVVEASSVALPSTGRAFREAWVLNGPVVEVDMVKAVDIKIDKIVAQAQERVAKAEAKAAKKALKGLPTSDEDAEVSKFKSKPKQAAIDAILNASTPDVLDAITVDQAYA